VPEEARRPHLKLTRRQLLKSAGVAAATGLATGVSADARALDILPRPRALEPDKLVPSFCEVCFWNCGLIARVRNNEVLQLSGHPNHPAAKGRLCARGNGGAGFVTNPDRLKYPMVRVGERGEGKFERVGWKLAYQHIARSFERIKQKHGPEALALFYHGKGGPLLRTMMVAYGTPNYAAPAYAQCKGPRDVAFKLTYGTPLPSPEPLDLEHTRCMVLFGSHLGENAHNSQVQEFVAARHRGAHLVVLDPRLSTAAARASVWLPVRPGSDLAVILAWIHLLVTRGTYHNEFVENQCIGLDELAGHVASFTPEWAAEQAGVPARDVVRAYELMVESMPAVTVHPGRHVVWYGEADTHRARGQAILTALLGAMWTEGGLYRWSRPSLPPYPGPDFPELPDNVDKAAGRYPFAKEVTTNGIRDATITGDPYPIKGWFVHATNLLQSMPDTRRTVEAIRQLDMLVVCDVQPTEITRWADVVLPEDTYLERYDDLSLGAGKQPHIALRQPAVVSPHDTRPAWRIAKELSQELGVGDFFAFDTFEQYLETRLEGSGVSLETLKKNGIALQEPKDSPYIDPATPHHWHTPSGKVELFSKQLADEGFDPLPRYTPQPDPPRGSFRLLYGRSPLHTFGRTQNTPILFDLDPTNCLWINPRCARRLGLEQGDPVMVENERGDRTGPLRAQVTERMPERAVYMIHGFGHRSREMSLACCVGGSDSEVIEHYAVDPISGATGMRVQFVTIRAADPDEELLPCATG
jgi:thiosulfate reductase/polysulfide reductase chain A